MSRTDFSSFSDEDLLRYALSHDQDAWSEIAERYDKRITSWCRGKAQDLPDDIWNDVIQETLESLSKKVSSFDPNRGAADRFVFGLFRNALKKSRRMYGSRPGVEVLYLGSEVTSGRVHARRYVSCPRRWYRAIR